MFQFTRCFHRLLDKYTHVVLNVNLARFLDKDFGNFRLITERGEMKGCISLLKAKMITNCMYTQQMDNFHMQ